MLCRKGNSMRKVLTLTVILLVGYLTLLPKSAEGIVLIPPVLEVALGREVAREIEAEYKLLNDPELTAYVDNVGQGLVGVCGRRDVEYEFKILDDDKVNAFACPGGFVYVTTGILKIMDNEAELAGILGHEIGHIAERHGVKRLQSQLGYGLLIRLLFKDEGVRKIANIAANLVFLGYGRENEFEADYLGTEYAYMAGYDPRAMREFLGKLKQLEGREPWAIEVLLKSHPPTSERIQKVEQQIQEFPTLSGKEMHKERFREAVAGAPPKAEPVPIPEAAPTEILLKEDFNDGIAQGFGDESGSWEVTDGRYAATTGIFRFSTAGDLRWKDYSLEADFINARDGGFLLRAQDHNNAIALIVRPTFDDIYWHMREEGSWGARYESKTLGHKPGENLHVKVEVRGNELRAYINGKLKTTLRWEGFPEGKIALYLSYQSDQYWDNVLVHGAPTP